MYDGIARKSAPYLFLGQTTSLCETCLGLVPAKIVEQDGGIYYSKRCPEHGVTKTLVSDDPVYWRRTLDYLKPGDRPLAPHTRTERGCPWDCGLCPDHEQHSCLAIVEINEACNLACPVCFADSSPKRNTHRSLGEIGEIVRHALKYKCVRGVNFQPVQDAGRNEGFDPRTNRIVLSEIRRRIVEDSGIFADGDMIPLPCNPASISIGYGVRNGERVIPLTSLVPREALLPSMPNAISFEKYPELRRRF